VCAVNPCGPSAWPCYVRPCRSGDTAGWGGPCRCEPLRPSRAWISSGSAGTGALLSRETWECEPAGSSSSDRTLRKLRRLPAFRELVGDEI
jgi:hypothetical protein